jgi:hypothetical protein
MASKKSQSSWGGAIIVIVGLPDAAAKESRDRVTTALANKLKGCPAPIHAAYEDVVMQPMKPFQGLRFLCLGTLGSSRLATQGWQIQSLWVGENMQHHPAPCLAFHRKQRRTLRIRTASRLFGLFQRPRDHSLSEARVAQAANDQDIAGIRIFR